MLALLLAGTAHAANNADEAELHFQMGFDAYDRGDYREALSHFMESNRLVPNANVVYNVARMFERLDQFPDAYRWYLQALQSGGDPETEKNVREALTRIAPKVAIFDVKTNPPGATIYVNRTELGSVGTTPTQVAYPDGTYTLLVEMEGHRPVQTKPMEVRIGSKTDLTFDLVQILGKAQVTSNEEGATVHVGTEAGEAACTVPCELPMSPGVHILYLKKEGFRSTPVQVEVRADETTVTHGSLVPLTGSIVVSTSERDALIEIDGRPAGYSPSVVPNVRVGSRKVRVTLRGYQPYEAEVDVKDGAEADLRGITLVPIRQVTAASRLPEAPEDAPSSITIVSGQELRAFGYPTIYEALRGVRGMSHSYDSVYGSIAVRGLGQSNDFGNKLLILSDGATLNDNILYQSFTSYDGRVDLGDVDHIEVVRGPGSVLYGTGAVSGVVNLVTRSTEEPTSAHAAVGTADNGVARARAGFNVKLGEHSGIWGSAAGARSDGYGLVLDIPSGNTTVPQPIVGADAFKAATTSGRIWAGDFTAQWFGTIREETITTGAYGTRFSDPDTEWVDTRVLAEARYEPELSDSVQLLTRVYYNQYDFDGTYVVPAANDTQFVYAELYQGRQVGAEPRIVIRGGDAVRFSVGAEFDYNLEASLFGNRKFLEDSTYLDENAPYLVAAGYGLLDLTPSEKFRISAGVRADSWTYSSAGQGEIVGENFLTANPRIAFILKPTPENIVKIMGGRAFRAPSVYELLYNDGGYVQARSDYGGNVLLPEQVTSGEIEYTRKFGTEWAGVVAAHGLYANQLVETVPTEETGDEAVFYKNTDAPQVFGGFDVEVRREFARGWMVNAVYGYLIAQYVEPPVDGLSTRAPNAPWHQASVKGIVPLFEPLANLAMRATLEAPRRINLSSDDLTDPAVITDVVLSGAVRDSGLFYNAGVYNLFDWKYAMPVTDSFAAPVMPQSGRTFLVTLGVQR